MLRSEIGYISKTKELEKDGKEIHCIAQIFSKRGGSPKTYNGLSTKRLTREYKAKMTTARDARTALMRNRLSMVLVA